MALPRTSASRGAAANRRAGSDYPEARCASCNTCNGTAKAFVHTIKRDYVRISPCPEANTTVHAPAISFDQSLQRGLLLRAKYLLFEANRTWPAPSFVSPMVSRCSRNSTGEFASHSSTCTGTETTHPRWQDNEGFSMSALGQKR